MALQPCASYRFTFSNPPECTILKVKLLRLLSWERGQTPSHNPPPLGPLRLPRQYTHFFSCFFISSFSSLVVFWCRILNVGGRQSGFFTRVMPPSFFGGKFACVEVNNVALRHNFMNLMILRERQFLPKYKNYCSFINTLYCCITNFNF